MCLHISIIVTLSSPAQRTMATLNMSNVLYYQLNEEKVFDTSYLMMKLKKIIKRFIIFLASLLLVNLRKYLKNPTWLKRTRATMSPKVEVERECWDPSG